MNKSDFRAIERALGFHLPEFYKEFMPIYDRELLLGEQPDWLPPVTEWEFAERPERVIELNRQVRNNPPADLIGDGEWPDQYFIIGREDLQDYFVTRQPAPPAPHGQARRGSGLVCNYMVVNRMDEDETVFLRSRVDGAFHLIATSLESYCEWLFEWWDIFRERGRDGAGP
jgi:hypothetical protein